jgi:hypothetical protein
MEIWALTGLTKPFRVPETPDQSVNGIIAQDNSDSAAPRDIDARTGCANGLRVAGPRVGAYAGAAVVTLLRKYQHLALSRRLPSSRRKQRLASSIGEPDCEG